MTPEKTIAKRGFDRRAIPVEAVESRWDALDGHRIRRIDWLLPDGPARGSLLFMPGRGDAYEKYLETLDHWHRKGWRVTAADWRGQALSGRVGLDEDTGHIDDFALWIEDLSVFWSQWQAATPAPHVLVGHSMGGHLALRAMAEDRIDPAAAVLCAPMLGLAPGCVRAWLLHKIALLMARLGDPRRPAWKGGERPRQLRIDRFELLTHDPDRYADEIWWREHRPELVLGAPSWGWIERAFASSLLLRRSGFLEKIGTPVLFLATTHDRLVDFGAIERAARRMPRAQLLTFGREARHEILREREEVRDRALMAIDDFLDRTAPVIDRAA